MVTVPPDIPTSSTAPGDDAAAALPRRDFLKAASAGAGLLLLGACAPAPEPRPVPGLHPKRGRSLAGGSSADIIVIGAGAWGGWTALNLLQTGARVTLVDAYGPANARATSGDETRGVRSSYGDRDAGELWVLWAREAIQRWKAFDAEWGRELRLSLFYTTGDVILRPEPEPFTKRTQEWWAKHKIPHEVLSVDEVRYRWPVIATDEMTVALTEPDAGVVRARRSAQVVVSAFEKLGGKIVIGRARPTKVVNGRLEEIALDTGHTLRADRFVFAVGPWMGKMFPDVLPNRTRTPLGYVCYFGTPVNDERFTYPNLPSFNFPGVTGWAALPVDSRGFRVRGSARPRSETAKTGAGEAAKTGAAGGTAGGTAASAGAGGPSPAVAARVVVSASPAAPPTLPTPPEQLDPDLSDRWADASKVEGPRRFLQQRFPVLEHAPILQTHACHYELTSSRDFLIDRHPRMSNVWLAGGGNAEGFKFGPVVGEYIAQRVLGDAGDPALAKRFRIPEKEYEPTPADSAAKAKAAGTKAAATKGEKTAAK